MKSSTSSVLPLSVHAIQKISSVLVLGRLAKGRKLVVVGRRHKDELEEREQRGAVGGAGFLPTCIVNMHDILKKKKKKAANSGPLQIQLFLIA